MAFKLSKKSLDILSTVDPTLASVVEVAIEETFMDFSVVEGIRSLERQRELYRLGKTHLIEEGKHLIGHAVDLYGWDGESRSDIDAMTPIWYAMRLGAIANNVAITWGGAWSIKDIRDWQESPQEAHQQYIRNRDSSEVSRDFVHFELT